MSNEQRAAHAFFRTNVPWDKGIIIRMHHLYPIACSQWMPVYVEIPSYIYKPIYGCIIVKSILKSIWKSTTEQLSKKTKNPNATIILGRDFNCRHYDWNLPRLSYQAAAWASYGRLISPQTHMNLKITSQVLRTVQRIDDPATMKISLGWGLMYPHLLAKFY